jgi:hypothetical protein
MRITGKQIIEKSDANDNEIQDLPALPYGQTELDASLAPEYGGSTHLGTSLYTGSVPDMLSSRLVMHYYVKRYYARSASINQMSLSLPCDSGRNPQPPLRKLRRMSVLTLFNEDA